uniref:Uncharacterized protein n=1 Tax=Oryza rufipogon TaxID=4529 RepID=A0A0E0PL70_ORYRU
MEQAVMVQVTAARLRLRVRGKATETRRIRTVRDPQATWCASTGRQTRGDAASIRRRGARVERRLHSLSSGPAGARAPLATWRRRVRAV